MLKTSLNKYDFLVILALGMGALALHQKFVAPKIAGK
jgi:hypothetical protein